MSTSFVEAVTSEAKAADEPAAAPAVERPRRAKQPPEPKKRIAPGRPVGKLMGGVIATIGLCYSLAVVFAGPDMIPWFWAPNAPEFNALVGGFLLAAGILVLLWRFSIRLMVLLILMAGAFGLVGKEVGKRTPLFHRTNIASRSTEMLQRLFNEGIAGTLAERGVFDADNPPFRAYYDFRKRLCVEIYPHADPRMWRMPQAIETFVFKTEGVDSKGNYRDQWSGSRQNNCQDAANYLRDTLAKRFGDENARAVMAKCVELVTDDDFKSAFFNAAEEIVAQESQATSAAPPVSVGPPRVGIFAPASEPPPEPEAAPEPEAPAVEDNKTDQAMPAGSEPKQVVMPEQDPLPEAKTE